MNYLLKRWQLMRNYASTSRNICSGYFCITEAILTNIQNIYVLWRNKNKIMPFLHIILLFKILYNSNFVLFNGKVSENSILHLNRRISFSSYLCVVSQDYLFLIYWRLSLASLLRSENNNDDDDLVFYIPFNTILGHIEMMGDNDRLCAMKPHKSWGTPPLEGFEPGTLWSKVRIQEH